MKERLSINRLLIPALLQRDFPGRLRYHDIVRIEFAVADDAHIFDVFDLLTDQLQNGRPEVARDPFVGARTLESVRKEHMVKALPQR